MKLAVFALLLGSACQTTTTESEATQDLTQDACNTPAPYAPNWDGTPPPLADVNRMFIMFDPVNGYSYTALVDLKAGTVPYARRVHVGKRNAFIAHTQSNYGRIVIGGNPPPPPDVIDPTNLGRYVRFAAMRYAGVPAETAGDVASCPANAPGPLGPLGPLGGF